MNERKGPVLIEIDSADPIRPQEAEQRPEGQAMQMAARLVARRPNRLARLFWASALGLVALIAGIAAWDGLTTLLATRPALGALASGLMGLAALALLGIGVRELAAIARLGRLDDLRRMAEQALAERDMTAAVAVVARLDRLYRGRPELALACRDLARFRAEAVDADTLIALTEARLMAPLDDAARAEIEAAARQVATVTALVPLAFADVVAVLAANIRMIRRIAEIYGGRMGGLGSWRLTRAVLTHLVATGAVAIGDDLIGSVAGGSILSKVSRRFGEGVVNGALTARVGLAAMELCRPLPFGPERKPGVGGLVRRALTGLFGQSAG